MLAGPDQLRAAIAELRRLTDRPFGVNLLLLPEVWDPQPTAALDDRLVEGVIGVANPIYDRLGLAPVAERPPTVPQLVDAALDVIVEERVPEFSAGLGDPGPEISDRLHATGIRTVVMVTNAGDARRVADSGADVVVAQGAEAGGHRSHFTMPAPGQLGDLGTVALVPEVVDAVDVPVVAAGGIVDGRGLVAALALSATGVLIGSRFVVTRESQAPEAHKKRLLEGRGYRALIDANTELVVLAIPDPASCGQLAVLDFPGELDCGPQLAIDAHLADAGCCSGAGPEVSGLWHPRCLVRRHRLGKPEA